MILIITDNGIGREQSAKATAMSTGVGLAMMKQYYSILNRHNQYPISETITDLKNSDGTAAGTRVVVQIPINLGFDLFHRNQNI